MFKDFSVKELKYYFGFGFLFFILDAFLFLQIFFRFINNANISVYWSLIVHDIMYILFYLALILFLAIFFKLELKRTMLFVLPQFYIYEYLGGFIVQGMDYFILGPKMIFTRLIILALGAIIIYLTLRLFKI